MSTRANKTIRPAEKLQDTVTVERGASGFIAYVYNKMGQRRRVIGSYPTEAAAQEWGWVAKRTRGQKWWKKEQVA